MNAIPAWIVVRSSVNLPHFPRGSVATVDATRPEIKQFLVSGWLVPLPQADQPNVPFIRQFGPGDEGPDVQAVKGALAVALGASHGMNLKTGTFGKPAQRALIQYKTSVGLLADPIYTKQAHAHLIPHFTHAGILLLQQEAERLARARFLEIADLSVQHHNLFTYTEKLGDAPGSRGWWRVAPLRWDGSVRYSCDCSQHFIGTGKHAGLIAPLYSSDGATGLILESLPHILLSHAQPGDAVVFVGVNHPAGAHITILRERLPSGDWKTVNMGAPGEPSYSTLSGQADYQRRHGAPTEVVVRLL